MTGLIAIGKRVRRHLFHKCLVHPFLRLCAMGCDGPSDGIVEISSCKSTHSDEEVVASEARAALVIVLDGHRFLWKDVRGAS